MRYIVLAALLLGACGGPSSDNTQNNSKQVVYEGNAMVMLDSARILPSAKSLDLNSILELGDGREVDFHLSDGATVTLRGPLSGKLGGLLEVDGTVEKWTKSAMDVLNKSANEGHVMTVRSASGEEAEWIPNAISVPSGHKYCIQAGMKPTLYTLGKTSSAIDFDIVSEKKSVSLSIPAGVSSEISWPEGLPVTGNFEFKKKGWFGGNTFSITELEVFDFPSLAKAGCTDQLSKLRQFTR